jgi:hypothetical protein
VSFGRDWLAYGETVNAEEPCGACGYGGPVHLGRSPTQGVRFAGTQVMGWAQEDIAVCGRCGQAEHMGSQGLEEARRTGSWSVTGVFGLGFIDVQSGRLKRRPLEGRFQPPDAAPLQSPPSTAAGGFETKAQEGEMELNREAAEVAKSSRSTSVLKNNKHGLTGLILGIVGYFLYEVGIIPILAIVFSGIGLGTHDPTQHKNRWMSVVGLISGIVGTFLYLYAYGYIE